MRAAARTMTNLTTRSRTTDGSPRMAKTPPLLIEVGRCRETLYGGREARRAADVPANGILRGGASGSAPRVTERVIGMEYRRFGRTDMKVSALGFGGSEIGSETDAGRVQRLLEGALDAGLNVVDTAACYGA